MEGAVQEGNLDILLLVKALYYVYYDSFYNAGPGQKLTVKFSLLSDTENCLGYKSQLRTQMVSTISQGEKLIQY